MMGWTTDNGQTDFAKHCISGL